MIHLEPHSQDMHWWGSCFRVTPGVACWICLSIIDTWHLFCHKMNCKSGRFSPDGNWRGDCQSTIWTMLTQNKYPNCSAPTAQITHLLDQCRSSWQSVAVDLVLWPYENGCAMAHSRHCFLQSRYPGGTEFLSISEHHPGMPINVTAAACGPKCSGEGSASDQMAT